MRAYFGWVLRHRVTVLVICAAISGLAALGLSRVTMSTSLSKLFLQDTADHRRYIERLQRYGGSEQLIIGIAHPALRDPAVQQRLRGVVEALQTLDGVARVDSIFSVTPAGRPADIDALAADPAAGGLLVSTDGRHTAVVLEFHSDDLHSLERAPAAIRDISNRFERSGIDRADLHFGGFVAMLAEIARQGRRNLAWITPLVGGLLLLTVYGFFRRLWPVLLTGLVAGLAILWTMGLSSLLDPRLNVLLAVAPALILIVSFSDVVHLCSAYAKELAGGRARDEAIMASAVDVGTACIMTSLTTFVGFVSISLIGVAAFRHLGIVLGFGTAVALLLAMTLVPIVFSFMQPPRPWTRPDRRAPGRILDDVLTCCERLATNHPWAVLSGTVLLMGALGWGCTRIHIETDFVARMSPHSALRRDTTYFNDHFSGTLAIELFLTAEDDATFGLGMLPRLAACHRIIAAYPQVTKVLPPLAVSSLQPRALTELTRFVDVTRREVHLVALVRETGVTAIFTLGERMRRDVQAALGPDITVEPSGFFYLAGRWLDAHLVTNQRALLVAFATISVILVLLFRSLRIGLWSLLPNLLPLLAVGGALGIVWGAVDSDAVIVLLITIGIAVDDTIHFLSRWSIEHRRGATPAAALHRAYGFAGSAIVQTSVIFAIGFAPMAISSYLPFRMLGMLMPLAVITALAGDMLVLPALIRSGAIRMPSARQP